MAKIIILDSDEKVVVQRNKLEVNVEIGELILLLNGKRVDEKGLVNSAIIGIFNGILEEHDGKKYGGNYQDKSYIKMLGVKILKPTEIPSGLSNESRTFWITRQIKQIYFPQEQIVQALQSWPGFEGHAEWVARLKKPYLE